MHKKKNFFLKLLLGIVLFLSMMHYPLFAIDSFQSNLTTTNKMNINELPPGTYLVVLRFEKDGVIVEEIIEFTINPDIPTIVEYHATGKNITVAKSQVELFVESDWLEKIDAQIINVTTQEIMDITMIDISDIKPVAGQYTLWFGNSEVGSSVIVTVIADENYEEETTTAIMEEQEKTKNNEIFQKNSLSMIWQEPDDASNYNFLNFEFVTIASISTVIIIILVIPLFLLFIEYRTLRKLFHTVRQFFVEN